MADEFRGGLIPGQGPAPATQIGEPSGNQWVNPNSVPDFAFKAGIALAPPLDLAAAVEAAKLQAEQAAQVAQERAKQAKVQAALARATVRGYAAEVDEAVKAAASIRGGPPAPFHFRKAARALIHDRGHVPPFGWGHHDPAVEQLAILQSRGEGLSSGNLKFLDEAGLFELDVAESKCWSAMMARARVVAGEA